jgi:hypothetical protein
MLANEKIPLANLLGVAGALRPAGAGIYARLPVRVNGLINHLYLFKGALWGFIYRHFREKSMPPKREEASAVRP